MGSELEPGEAFHHVLRPAQIFAELAVAHDVYPGFNLLADHIGHRDIETVLKFVGRRGLAVSLGSQQRQQRFWPNQAAGVGYRNVSGGHGEVLRWVSRS